MEMKLFYMGDIADLNEEQAKVAEAFITNQIYGVIATNNAETGARLSALNNLRGQTLTKLHYGTQTTTQKAKNIAADPRMEVMYTDGNGGQVMLSGKAEIVMEESLKQELWEDWMNEYSPEGPTGNGMCIIRFIPKSMRVMIG